MEKLILIDGSSILYRAFFALPHFTTKTGESTGAIYGFLQMLKKLIKDENPTYLAVAFDTAAPTARHIAFEEYKANRPKAPDELQMQFLSVREMLDAFAIKYVEIEGYEADDVIATMVEKFGKDDLQIIVVTGDMDLLQLASEKTFVYLTKRGVTNIEVYDSKRVFEEFGVEPERLPELKALAGDNSDNIPGVPGVGIKTAAKILKQSGSLEELLNKREIKGIGDIKQYENHILRNKELVTLCRNLDIQLVLEDLRLRDIRTDEAKKLLTRFEFKSILKELFPDTPESSLDFSTSGNKKHCVVLIEGEKAKKYCYYDGTAFVENEIGEELFRNKAALDHLRHVLEKSDVIKHTNNLKELYRLKREMKCEFNSPGIDISIASFLINPDENGDGFEFFKKAFGNNPQLDSSKSMAAFLFKNADRIEQEMRRNRIYDLYSEIEKPLAEVLVEMEERGIKIDVQYFRELQKEIKLELDELENQIFKLTGIPFNIMSSKQLSEMLFEEIGLSPTKSSKTGYSTSIAALEEIKDKHPIIPLVIEYRHLSKLLSTYIEPFPRIVSRIDGRLHTNYEIIGTATGRLRSTNPNLQNIPIKGAWGEKIRKGFVASSDTRRLIGADYSQIELRVLAHMSEDPLLVKTLQEGVDIHTSTAMQIFNLTNDNVSKEMRARAKAINFAVIYGVTPIGLSRQIGCSIEEAQFYINEYFRKHSKVKEFLEDTIESAKVKNETRTIMNRRRVIRGFDSKNYATVENAKRLAINSPIQGSAADIIKKAMIDLFRASNSEELWMLLQIHDELVFECEQEKAQEFALHIRDIMSNAVKLKVPLEVNVSWGKNLLETKV